MNYREFVEEVGGLVRDRLGEDIRSVPVRLQKTMGLRERA